MTATKFIITHPRTPQEFAPCEAESTILEKSIKLHPAITAIRNKRKRARAVKRLHRNGVRFCLVPGWIVTPQPNSSP